MSHGHNKEFLKNPRTYLRTVAVENHLEAGKQMATEKSAKLDVSQPHGVVYLDLRSIGSGTMVGSGSDGKQTVVPGVQRASASYSVSANAISDVPIVGMFIPYVSEGDVKAGKRIGCIKLPANPGAGERFVFTGAMNGCSFVLAQDDGGAKWAVHYPNSTGAGKGFPLLEPAGLKAIKSMNYAQYGEDRAELESLPQVVWSNAFCCLFYDDNDWWILCQTQLVRPVGDRGVGGFATQINPQRSLLQV
jgi:hypothetical protein